MPTALVISRYFPPLSSAGASIRLVKFIKYIASQDWKLIIITQDPDRTVVPEDRLSAFLEEEIPPETIIVRVPAPFSGNTSSSELENKAFQPHTRRSGISTFLSGYIGRIVTRLFPGLSLWWGIRVFLLALRNMKAWGVDLIYAVAPTFTNALIGTMLRWFTGKPFVFDMKDDWVGSPAFQQRPAWRRAIERMLEAVIIKSAAQVVLATERSYRLYKERYLANLDQKKFHFIPNGCDLAEFMPLRNRTEPPASDKFLILSAAWGYQKDYRDITPFFLGLGLFFRNNPSAQYDVDVVFLGNNLSPEYAELIKEVGLPMDCIKEIGPVARKELVEWLWSSNLFFLVQPVGNTTAISGTLYEYWAVQKAPILLIAEEGASSRLVDENHLGKSFRFDEIIGIASYVEKIYQSHKNKQSQSITNKGIEAFDRKTLALQMADIWRKSLVNNE